MAERITAPRGTHDILPAEAAAWQWLEGLLRETARAHGYGEIRFPTFEHTELFRRGVGDTTDVVQKEMYTFEDKGGRSVTLRPEGTASVARAFVEHSLHAAGLPVKLYYMAPNFRYEKPQAGRYREHRQFGAECFGPQGPAADAELIGMAAAVFGRLGLADISLRINSIGCPACRPAYMDTLRAFLEENRAALCPDCEARRDRNPLRAFDCKEPGCAALMKAAPLIPEALCPDCRTHLDGLAAQLAAMGIAYKMDPFIVRGLDYYTRTVFEFTTGCLGAQSTVCGGGRYDGLIKELGGPETPALGFGMGLERLLLVLEAQGLTPPSPPVCDVYVAVAGHAEAEAAAQLVQALRGLGRAAERDLMGRSLKAQMKAADRLGACFALVLGESERKEGVVRLKDMKDGTESPCALDAAEIDKRIRGE